MTGPDRSRGSTRQVTTATPAGLDFRATGAADEGCADTMSTESDCSIALRSSGAQGRETDCHPQGPGIRGSSVFPVRDLLGPVGYAKRHGANPPVRCLGYRSVMIGGQERMRRSRECPSRTAADQIHRPRSGASVCAMLAPSLLHGQARYDRRGTSACGSTSSPVVPAGLARDRPASPYPCRPSSRRRRSSRRSGVARPVSAEHSPPIPHRRPAPPLLLRGGPGART